MSSKRKSTSDRKSKESHRSRHHRDKKSNGNGNEFLEPVYIVHPALPRTNNVPFLVQTPLYGHSHAAWDPISSVGYINPSNPPVFTNGNRPTQLSIGPLYLLADGRPNNENPVILEGPPSISVDTNRSMFKVNPHTNVPNVIQNMKPGSSNVVEETYCMPKKTEDVDLIKTWESKNQAKTILIDTPTQYEYEVPTSNRTASRLLERLRQENSECLSETSNRSSFKSNESWIKISKQESGDSVFQENSSGDLTIMRVTDRNESSRGDGFTDLNAHYSSRHSRWRPKTRLSTQASKLHRTIRCKRDHTKKNREALTKICIEVPVSINDIEKEKSEFSTVEDGSRRNIETKYNKTLNCNYYRYTKKNNAKSGNFRRMTTEDSINDLYRKINDIQSSIGASSVNGLLSRKSNYEARSMAYPEPFNQSVYPRQSRYYDGDMILPATNTITRGISPINFRTIENNGSCCYSCCHQRVINGAEQGLSFHALTRDIDTITDSSNNLNQCHCSCQPETELPNDEIHYLKMYYPQTNTSFQPNIDLGRASFPPINENIRIVIDQEAECQAPSLSPLRPDSYSSPMQEMCDRPCNCPENRVFDLYSRDFSGGPAENGSNYFSTRDNSTLYSPSDLPISYGSLFKHTPNIETAENRSASVQTPKILNSRPFLEQAPSCPCPSIPPNPCHCDLNKELVDIMDKIEDSIILKLERKTSLLKDRAPSIQENRKIRFNQESRNAEIVNQETLPTKLQESVEAPIHIDNSEVIIENNYMSRPSDASDYNRHAIIKQSHRPTLIEGSNDERYSERLEDNYPDTPPATTRDMRSSKAARRSSRPSTLSSYLQRRTSRQSRRGAPSLIRSGGPGRSGNSHYPGRKITPIQGSGYRRGSSAFGSIYNRRSNTPTATITNVLTACIENDNEASKGEYGFSKDISSDSPLESDKVSLSSIVGKNEQDGKRGNSYQIRRIKLSGPKKHLYILVKRRNEGKNTSSRESQETFNISTFRTNIFKGSTGKKKSSLNIQKPKQIHKIYLKSSKEDSDKSKVEL